MVADGVERGVGQGRRRWDALVGQRQRRRRQDEVGEQEPEGCRVGEGIGLTG